MKRKDFWKGFGVALALVVVLNLAWKPICRAIPWHLLPFEISMSKDAKVDMIQSYLDKYYDGLLRLFAFMHLSGRYQIIFPQ